METEYIINRITKEDLFTVENIGQISLPIYYKVSDLFFLLFDSEYSLYKTVSLCGKIAGFIVARKYNRRHHILSIAVHPDYRKKGVGTMLVNKIKDLDNDEISLYVLTTNKQAITFYEKNGFKCVKKLDNYYSTLDTKSAFYYNYVKNTDFKNKSDI